MAQRESSTLSFRLPDAAAGDRPGYAGMNVERPLLLAAIGRFGSHGHVERGRRIPCVAGRADIALNQVFEGRSDRRLQLTRCIPEVVWCRIRVAFISIAFVESWRHRTRAQLAPPKSWQSAANHWRSRACGAPLRGSSHDRALRSRSTKREHRSLRPYARPWIPRFGPCVGRGLPRAKPATFPSTCDGPRDRRRFNVSAELA